MGAEAAVPAPRSPGAGRFLFTLAAWIVVLCGFLRLPLVQEYVVLPLTRAQGWLATWGDARAAAAIVVTLECSGTDAIALLAAALLAYPAAWRRRLAGVAGGLGLLLALNAVRIASLSRVAGTEAFESLHARVWPTVLMMVAVLYVAGWMWAGEAGAPRNRRVARWLVWAGTSAAFCCLFALVTPLAERGAAMARMSVAAATSTAALMNGMGLPASATGSSLLTAQGWFLVTPQCLLTPLMPVYLAAALVLTRARKARLGALALFVPLFGLLAIARLLTLAVPPVFGGSPLVLVHGFHQLVLGVVLVFVAAFGGWADGQTVARGVRLAAAAAAVLSVAAGSGAVRAVLEAEAAAISRWIPHTLTRLAAPGDAQGALLLLPAYQLALFSALWLAARGWRRPRRLLVGLALLHVSHVGVLAVLGELGGLPAGPLPVVLVRVWAVAAPLGLCIALWPRPRPKRAMVLSSPLPA